MRPQCPDRDILYAAHNLGCPDASTRMAALHSLKTLLKVPQPAIARVQDCGLVGKLVEILRDDTDNGAQTIGASVTVSRFASPSSHVHCISCVPCSRRVPVQAGNLRIAA